MKRDEFAENFGAVCLWITIRSAVRDHRCRRRRRPGALEWFHRGHVCQRRRLAFPGVAFPPAFSPVSPGDPPRESIEQHVRNSQHRRQSIRWIFEGKKGLVSHRGDKSKSALLYTQDCVG